MAGLKIIFLGNFKAICSGSLYSTESHLVLSMEEMGHEVLRLQEEKTNIEQILEIQDDYDLMFYSRTYGCLGDFNKFLQSKTISLIAYSLDIYLGLPRADEVYSMFKADYVFTADGGHEKLWKEKGINHFFLPAGVYGKEAYLAEQTELYKQDVIFVGSYRGYHKEYPFREQLIDWLKETYGDRFTLWGEGRGIRGPELNKLYASIKVVVGDSLESPNYWSDRVYETLGRGGFLIHPRTEGMEKEFTDKKHLVFYDRGDWQQLRNLIDYYLEHNEEREAIRIAGHELVKSKYTYVDRLKEVFKQIDMTKPLILNLGAGRQIIKEAINLDIIQMDGIDKVWDCNKFPYPFENEQFDKIIASDILEHLEKPEDIVNECWRILKPYGTLWIRGPDGRVPEAIWDDITHKRGFTLRSFDHWDETTELGKSYGFYYKHKFRKLSVVEKNNGIEFLLRKVI